MKRPKYINRPYQYLPLKQRAIYILSLAGITQEEIGKLLVVSQQGVSKVLSSIYKKKHK
jgi:DNA-directed RNA polymerase specialized sigma subunit